MAGAKDRRGGQGRKQFNISRYNINPKKWADGEKQNLSEALGYMEKLFGDISDVTGEIKKKHLSGAAGMHEYGMTRFDGGVIPKETLFDTGSFADTGTMVHEFTHAVAETLAHNAKALGFSGSDDFYNQLRTEAYTKAGKEEPSYDGRKWKDRAVEFPAIQIQNHYTGNKYASGASDVSNAALSVLQKYWRQYRRAK